MARSSSPPFCPSVPNSGHRFKIRVELALANACCSHVKNSSVISNHFLKQKPHSAEQYLTGHSKGRVYGMFMTERSDLYINPRDSPWQMTLQHLEKHHQKALHQGLFGSGPVAEQRYQCQCYIPQKKC